MARHHRVELGAGAQRVGGDVEVAADVEGGDGRARLGEREAVRAALPTGGAGDQRDLAGEVGVDRGGGHVPGTSSKLSGIAGESDQPLSTALTLAVYQ